MTETAHLEEEQTTENIGFSLLSQSWYEIDLTNGSTVNACNLNATSESDVSVKLVRIKAMFTAAGLKPPRLPTPEEAQGIYSSTKISDTDGYTGIWVENEDLSSLELTAKPDGVDAAIASGSLVLIADDLGARL